MPTRINVKQFRDRTGLSAQKLADKLGVHLRTVRRWESAEVDPSPLANEKLRQIVAEHDRASEPEKPKSGPKRQSHLDSPPTLPSFS